MNRLLELLVLLSALLLLINAGAASAGEAGYDAIVVRSDLPYEWIIAKAYSEKAKIPIIAVEPKEIKKETREMLSGFKASGAGEILILGGESAISPEIAQEIEGMGFTTHRISETDRYGTSARVAVDLYSGADEVVIVSADKADFLLLGERLSLAAGAPILFVKHDAVPKSTYDALNIIRPERIFIITDSKTIEDELRALGTGIEKIESYEEIKRYDSEEREKSRFRVLVIITTLSGLLLLFFIYRRRREKKLAYAMLTSDEDKIISAIKEKGGEILQEELYEITGFSRPKISRLVMELEERKLIAKEQFKKTFKLKINKEVV